MSRRRREAEPDPEVPLAPLIDMVFTILIFLLVSATFAPRGGIPLDLPSAEASAEAEGEFVVTIDAALDLATPAGRTSLAELPELVRAAFASGGPRRVVVAADRDVPAGLVVDVYDAAYAGGAERVVLATERPR
jgi:biopolymer transport protein ExbD